MRSASLAWAAVLPLLVACAAEPPPIGESSDEPEIVAGKKDEPTSKAGDRGAPGAAPGAAGAAGPAASTCLAQPACNGTAAPQLGAKRPFTHALSGLIASGSANHRGRDQIISVGEPQWVIGKIAYGVIDKDLKDEDVDVFVERGCAGAWEQLGTVKTTNEGAHATVEGVPDSGGRVYFEIPRAKELAAGRHRIRLVVAGDHTSTDLVIDVLPKGSPVVVSDVDGTLTSSEVAEFPALLVGALPDAQPHAADALAALAAKGHHVVYLTARPELLTARTHEFLAKNGFPPGIVHTTTGATGAFGGAAATFKSDELAMLKAHGHTIAWAFGNQPSDTDAYDAAKINPVDHRVFLGVTDSHGGRRIEAYADLVPVLTALPSTCN